jgi:hypothetical protein
MTLLERIIWSTRFYIFYIFYIFYNVSGWQRVYICVTFIIVIVDFHEMETIRFNTIVY